MGNLTFLSLFLTVITAVANIIAAYSKSTYSLGIMVFVANYQIGCV